MDIIGFDACLCLEKQEQIRWQVLTMTGGFITYIQLQVILFYKPTVELLTGCKWMLESGAVWWVCNSERVLSGNILSEAMLLISGSVRSG